MACHGASDAMGGSQILRAALGMAPPLVDHAKSAAVAGRLMPERSVLQLFPCCGIG